MSVTLFVVAVLLLAAWNAGQAITAAQQLSFMQSLGVDMPGRMLMVRGVTWMIGFSIAALGLWRLRAWGRHWMLIAIVAYQLQIWIERFTLKRSFYEVLTRPADLIVSLCVVIGVWGLLFLPKIRRAFSRQQQPRKAGQS